MTTATPVVLIILDGWGVGKTSDPGNPITPKNAPHYFSWLKKYPHTILQASGEAVGLFKGQEGNSEAGHLNLGAGRVVKQDALYISDAIKDHTFFKNNAFAQALHHVKKYRTAVHLMGLLSNHNSAHSSPEHLYALLELFHRAEVKKVWLHLFTDGRDSGQHDAPDHLKKLRERMFPETKIASLMGRLYAMDRNKNWERTKRAYEALTLGKGRAVESAEAALTLGYNSGETDEFIRPSIVSDSKGRPLATVGKNDALFFFNLRSDRARQLTKAFVQPDFEKANPGAFTRQRVPKNIRFVAMTDFGPDLLGVLTAFPCADILESLPSVLGSVPQLYVAESEKFAHVTYFFNGGYAEHRDNVRWVQIVSNGVKGFEVDPAMRAKEIARYVVRAITRSEYKLIVVNFANADMLGHTGNLAAAARGLKALDTALARVVAAAGRHKNVVVITADHGNVEEMINAKTGEVDSEHSVNPVPCLIINQPGLSAQSRIPRGRLSDVAPTILKIMGIKQPKAMTGRSLV